MPLDLTKTSAIITGNAASMAFWGECRHCKTVAVAPMVMKASRLSTCKEVIATLNASSRIPKTVQERTLRANSPFRAEAHRTMQSLPARRQKGPTRPLKRMDHACQHQQDDNAAGSRQGHNCFVKIKVSFHESAQSHEG